MTTIQYIPSLFMGISELEEKLGLSEGFFDALLREDDWSFVIKLHALFEAVCTHLIVYHIHEERVKNIVSRLELSDKITGKIAFLKALGLLGQHQRQFFTSLSELRNKLVHDIHQSSFNLTNMVATFDKKEIKNFTKSFSPAESKTVRPDIENILAKAKRDKNSSKQSNNRLPLFVDVDPETMKQLEERARTYPKLHIWAGALNTLLHICDMYSLSNYMQEVRAKNILESDDDET